MNTASPILSTFSTADLLAELNRLREANGKKPLSSWKASRVELEQRVQQEQPAPAAPVTAAPDAAVVAKAIKPNAGKAFLGALRDVLNGADPDHIVDTMKAHGVEPKVTKIEATAPELTKPAKRKAAIDAQVQKAIDTDTPTTKIDLRIKPRKQVKPTKTEKVADTANAARQGKKTKTPAATGKGEFAIYLESIGLEGRVARAKLRRAKIKPINGRYELTDAVKAALTADGRKKTK